MSTTAATMTSPSRGLYPPDVHEVIDQVRERVAAGERLPGLKAMRRTYRIGDDKARAVREALRAELDAGLLVRGRRRLHVVDGQQVPAPQLLGPGVLGVPDAGVPDTPPPAGQVPPHEGGTWGVPTGVLTSGSADRPAALEPAGQVPAAGVPEPAAAGVPDAGVPGVPDEADEAPWEDWGGSYLMTGRAAPDMGQDAAVDTEIRAAWRASRQRAGLAEAARFDREAAASDQIADREVTDRVWATRARSDADRLTSPAARMVFLAKARRAVYGLFLALIVGGTAWGSVNARATLLPTVHDPSALTSAALFGVDPLVSGLLVALLIVRAALSQRGEHPRMRGLGAVEAALLGATLLLNAGPYLPGVGVWAGLLPAFAHALPALIVTATVAVFPQVDAAFAAMLQAARGELR